MVNCLRWVCYQAYVSKCGCGFNPWWCQNILCIKISQGVIPKSNSKFAFRTPAGVWLYSCKTPAKLLMESWDVSLGFSQESTRRIRSPSGVHPYLWRSVKYGVYPGFWQEGNAKKGYDRIEWPRSQKVFFDTVPIRSNTSCKFVSNGMWETYSIPQTMTYSIHSFSIKTIYQPRIDHNWLGHSC